MPASIGPGPRHRVRDLCRCAKPGRPGEHREQREHHSFSQSESSSIVPRVYQPPRVHHARIVLGMVSEWTLRSGEADRATKQATEADGGPAIADAGQFGVNEVAIGGRAVRPVSVQEGPYLQAGPHPSGIGRPDPRIFGGETVCEIGADIERVRLRG